MTELPLIQEERRTIDAAGNVIEEYTLVVRGHTLEEVEKTRDSILREKV